MYRIFTSIICLLLVASTTLAATPTVPASNFVYSTIEGSRLTVRFTSGNGSSRIVVMRMSNPVTGLPVNGTDYTSNLVFGTAGAAFTAPDEYVVYKGSSNTFTVTNLQPNTTYHFAVFEFNGSAATTEYLMIPLTGSRSTAVTPATQVSNLTFSQVAGSSVRLNFTVGSGEGRLVLIRKGAPVNAVPTDLTTYTSSGDFGSGAAINGDNYVIYAGNSNTAIASLLEPATTYHFAVFERSGTSFPVYKSPGATGSITTNAGPTTPTASFSFSSIEGDRINVTVSKGNGLRRLIIAKKGGPVTSLPQNNQTYAANSIFGSGSEMATGEFVVFNNTTNSVTLTNLEPNSVYHFRSIEYDQDGEGNIYYLNTPRDNSSNTAATPLPPNDLSIINVTGNSLTLRYNAGTGSYRFVVGREAAAVNVQPQDLVKYNGNPAFGNGTNMGDGNFVLTGGANGTSINISNLRPGVTYHFAVFEYSGVNYPVYSTTSGNISITMPAEPTVAASNFSVNTVQGSSFRSNWTNGDGSRRLVVARKGSAVTALPVDGITYTANVNFGNGTALAPDQFVVFDGTNTTVTMENLEISTTYHIAVFEYNQTAAGPDYLTGSFLAGSGTTASAPTQQVSSITSTSIQLNTASFTYTPGNGDGQLFVIKQGSPVDAEPVDLVNYGINSIFGNALLANGNYLVHRGTTGSQFTIHGLQPGTTYYLAAFDFNGTSSPVYARPGVSISFTTAGVAPTPEPTVAAGNASISNQDGNTFRLNWEKGNGTDRLVVASIGTPPVFVPADGTSYTANAVWEQGQDVGNGQYIVYQGNGSNVTLTGLAPDVTIHFAVFEFNGTATATNYLTTAYLTASGSTLSAPTTPSNSTQSIVTGTSVQLQWQKGNGQNRIVIMRESGAVTGLPATLTAYPANNHFGSGSQTGLGEFVVYSGSAQQVTVTGLSTNKTYHYRIVEYNGSSAPVYGTTYTDGQFSVGTPLPVAWLYFRATRESNGVQLKWATSVEESNDRFVIERAQDNGSFVAIDSISGAGTSSQVKEYQYVDQSATSGTLRYRIKQVDIDGRFTYTAIVHIAGSSTVSQIQLYPNPAQDEVYLKGWTTGNAASVSIIDMNARVVSNTSVQQGQSLNISTLKAGQYLVRLVVNDKEYVLRMMKAK